MSEWQPIETYDALAIKPKLAVFRFKPVASNQRAANHLDEHFEMRRCFGSRECTHWMPLPPPPQEQQETIPHIEDPMREMDEFDNPLDGQMGG